MIAILPARRISESVLVEAQSLWVERFKRYRGVDLEGKVAAPVMVRELAPSPSDPDAGALFERAAQARLQMRGSPIPTLLRTLGHGGRIMATVEEYVGGTALSELLKRRPWMPPEIALAIGRALVSMWTVAEDASPPVRFHIVDPETILVDPEGRVRVSAYLAEEGVRQAVHTVFPHAAPEQVTRNETAPQSAMFVLGILLFEMLAGTYPFQSEYQSRSERISKLAQADAPSLGSCQLDLPPAVVELVRRCLSLDPRDRFPSFRALSRALGAAQSLFPNAGPTEIARCLAGLDPRPTGQAVPPIAPAETWPSLVTTLYEEMPLPPRTPER